MLPITGTGNIANAEVRDAMSYGTLTSGIGPLANVGTWRTTAA